MTLAQELQQRTKHRAKPRVRQITTREYVALRLAEIRAKRKSA